MRSLPIHPVIRLSAGVHAAAVGDDLVLLDVRADAYHCLAGAGGAIASGEGPSRVIFDADIASLLLAGGLADCEPGPVVGLTPVPILPRTSAISVKSDPPRWSDVPEAARGVADVAKRYRGRPFSEVLKSAGPSAPVLPDAAPSAELLALTQRFHRWIPYAPVSGKCLLRSFMLLRALRRSGHDARWVFGVATWPFRAHCWLQYGDVALDDSADFLAAFTPIMAV